MVLTKEQLDILRTRLEEEKVRLESALGVIADKEGDGEFSVKFPEDIGDRIDENATEVEQFTDNIAVESTLETQLKDVKDALAKMDTGTYGICEKTGKEIPFARLEANPAARTVVDA